MTFDPPRIDRIGRFLVVRDDLLPGGTKRRVAGVLFGEADEVVYATPAQGFAQVALAYAAADAGRKATMFVAARRSRSEPTSQAAALGARIVEVPVGYMTVVRARAREYCAVSGARLLPFGLDHPAIHAALAEVALSLGIAPPPEVWCAAGSGTLSRALQTAWPAARHVAVRVGANPNVGAASLLEAPEPFERRAKMPPPFPSHPNYDAKVWRFLADQGQDGALFWNVA